MEVGLNSTGADTILVDPGGTSLSTRLSDESNGARAEGRGFLPFGLLEEPLKKRFKNFKSRRNTWFPSFGCGRCASSVQKLRNFRFLKPALENRIRYNEVERKYK